MCVLCIRRRSCSYPPLESTVGRIGSWDGDSAETDHRKDMLVAHGCHICLNTLIFFWFGVQGVSDLPNITESANILTS